MGPLSPTTAAKSYSPAIPSLNVARRRYPPRGLILATLIIVETCNLAQRLAGAGSAPIILQFVPMRQCPLPDQMHGVGGKMPLNDFAGRNRDIGLVPAIRREKMRRRMVDKEHPNGDPIEIGNGRHRGSPSN